MSAAPTVCVALVTYNRKHLLLECLDALLRQTQPVDRIFVIDNGSTDGTAALVEGRGYMQQPVLTYIREEQNTGGAGGFHRGLQLGAEAGFDWIWCMDDDAEPAPDALELALAVAADQTTVALANFKVSAEGIPQNAHMHLASGEPASTLANTPALQPLTFSSFVGLLVRGPAVQQIGLPRREFFLNHDDNEYCARLRRIGSILLVPASVIRHKEAALKGAIARSFLGIRRNRLPLRAFLFRYFAMRNELVTYGQLAGRTRMLLRAAKETATQSAMVLAFRDDHPLTRLHLIAKAHLDAIRGNFDNDFPFRSLRKL